MSWLYWSIIVGSCLILIGFLFVLGAQTRFYRMREFFKDVALESGCSVNQIVTYACENFKVEKLTFVEGGDYWYDSANSKISIDEDAQFSSTLFDVTAVSHEIGHAIEHTKGSLTMAIWYVLAKMERITAKLVLPLFGIGTILSFIPGISIIGVILLNLSSIFTLLMLFNRIINLPNEKRASNNGLEILRSSGALTELELKGAKKILSSALNTYVLEFYHRLFYNVILAKRVAKKVVSKLQKEEEVKGHVIVNPVTQQDIPEHNTENKE